MAARAEAAHTQAFDRPMSVAACSTLAALNVSLNTSMQPGGFEAVIAQNMDAFEQLRIMLEELKQRLKENLDSTNAGFLQQLADSLQSSAMSTPRSPRTDADTTLATLVTQGIQAGTQGAQAGYADRLYKQAIDLSTRTIPSRTRDSEVQFPEPSSLQGIFLA